MAARTSIEWTRGDDGTPGATWNPVTGCTEVSAGCDHCFAKTFAERFRGTPGHYFEHGFDVVLRPGRLDQPLRWRKPKRIFVNSMSDLFHAEVPDEFIAHVFVIMALTPRHTFQLLTKRHARMHALLSRSTWLWEVEQAAENLGHDSQLVHDRDWPLPNLWLGVSVENQQWANIRVPALLETPAAVRFLSCEPLLGPMDLTDLDVRAGRVADAISPCDCDFDYGGCGCPERIDWVIAGGESGPGARPMHPAWARSLRDQCTTAGVPFFFKQWGTWAPESLNLHTDGAAAAFLDVDGTVRPLHNGVPTAPPRSRGDAITVRRVGKHHAGRLLDGHAWDQTPPTRSSSTARSGSSQ